MFSYHYSIEGLKRGGLNIDIVIREYIKTVEYPNSMIHRHNRLKLPIDHVLLKQKIGQALKSFIKITVCPLILQPYATITLFTLVSRHLGKK